MADINAPLTEWRRNIGEGEAIFPGTLNLVDTTGAYVVDTTGLFIVDTGTNFQRKPLTIWTGNDGI